MTMSESIQDNIDPYADLLTPQDVAAVIKKSIGSTASVISYSVKPYSDTLLGFMSDQRKLIVQVSRDESATEESHAYFFKCVPYDKELQAGHVKEFKVFEKETNFYNLIIPHIMRSSKDKSWAVQCYLAKKDVIVFEDLQVKSYALKDIFIDITLVKAALTSMAKLHAASLQAEKRLGKTFLELYPHLLTDVTLSPEGPFASWLQAGINLSTALVEKLGLNSTSVAKAFKLAWKNTLPSKTRRNVMCHGDANVRNLMFNPDGKCALVDFQMFIYAPAMVDVAQLIYLNVRKRVREERETELLRYYYEAFCDALEGGDVNLPSFDDLVEEYCEMRVVGIVTANLYFPMDFLDSKLLADFVNNSEGSQSFYTQDRKDVVFKFMEENENYRQFVTSLVTELVEISQI